MLKVFLDGTYSMSCFTKISVPACMTQHPRCRGSNFRLTKPIICYLISKVSLHASVSSVNPDELCCSCDPSQPKDFLLDVKRPFQVDRTFSLWDHMEISISANLVIEWENGKLSLWSREKASLQPSQEPDIGAGDGEEMGCLTNQSSCIKCSRRRWMFRYNCWNEC